MTLLASPVPSPAPSTTTGGPAPAAIPTDIPGAQSATPVAGEQDGIEIGGGWIRLPLAAAAVAAAGLVWLRRRHRYRYALDPGTRPCADVRGRVACRPDQQERHGGRAGVQP